MLSERHDAGEEGVEARAFHGILWMLFALHCPIGWVEKYSCNGLQCLNQCLFHRTYWLQRRPSSSPSSKQAMDVSYRHCEGWVFLYTARLQRNSVRPSNLHGRHVEKGICKEHCRSA